MDKLEKCLELLTKYKQDIVLEELKRNKNEELIKQILEIDFEQLEKLYNQTKIENEFKDDVIEPIEYTKEIEEEYKTRKVGEEVIRKGKYAVVTMAGGQGTRLGHKGPKGTFKIDVKPKAKYLFEIIVETLKRQNEKYDVVIPWYVMTSNENNDETVQFLERNNYFGYPKEKVKTFVQGELPILNKEGKMLLDAKGLIKKASDGNGSIYSSMDKNGIIKHMKENGVEWIYISSIDNILLKLVEPMLVGLTIGQGNKTASKTITKVSPEERVGVFCKKNGTPSVIEYTELPEEMSKLRDENGELIYGEAHIMCNLFHISAIEKIAEEKLPYHIAVKKISYYEGGKEIIPEEPNAYKFESFIFDGFSKFENITLLRGKREEDFAPVKNKEGKDSPQTAIELYNKRKME